MNLEPSDVAGLLAAKLDPRRFTAMSPKMAAIVGFILDEEFTSPRIAEIIITSDGVVLARDENDCGYNNVLGAIDQLRDNWSRLLDAADLDTTERMLADRLFTAKAGRWP